jgi:hypothetical protein
MVTLRWSLWEQDLGSWLSVASGLLVGQSGTAPDQRSLRFPAM